MFGLPDSQIFDANDAAFVTAAKAPQIEYFVRQELIAPARPASRRGVSRGYSVQNLIEIAVAIELLDSGIQVPEIALALAKVREHYGDLSKEEKLAANDYVLTIYRYPLTAPTTVRDRNVVVDIGPMRLLPSIAKAHVIRANLPLLRTIANVVSRIMALRTWQQQNPAR